jgi:hypothetical protein
MELDPALLREAKLENLERLARALEVRLPAHKRRNRDAYGRALVRLVARALTIADAKPRGQA